MIKNNNKGFTLIELLVVVLIIGILAAMAMPQYFKAMERSRMTEAVTLLANIAQAQQRKYMQINAYAKNYSGLDVAPKGASAGNYCTKGTLAADGKCGKGNGFLVALEQTNTGLNDGNAVATRVGPGNLQYQYSLVRFYNGEGTQCNAGNKNGAELCMDFCGLDETPAANYKCCSDGTTGDQKGSCAKPTMDLGN
ncbi:type IV pilin protein [Candidatus Avelusimicrobium fimicolum]|jgi:type IV pilus assembly protein PilA|uniref:type IV pilin protein n=2 Tax=Candidatus Avelusimicrobium TaxID=2840538 RepID=UPI003D13378B